MGVSLSFVCFLFSISGYTRRRYRSHSRVPITRNIFRCLGGGGSRGIQAMTSSGKVAAGNEGQIPPIGALREGHRRTVVVYQKLGEVAGRSRRNARGKVHPHWRWRRNRGRATGWWGGMQKIPGGRGLRRIRHWRLLCTRRRTGMRGRLVRFGAHGRVMQFRKGKGRRCSDIQCGRSPIPVVRQSTVGVIILVRGKKTAGPGSPTLP